MNYSAIFDLERLTPNKEVIDTIKFLYLFIHIDIIANFCIQIKIRG